MPSGPPADWPVAPGGPAPPPSARRRRWPWVAVAGALVVVGAAGATVGAASLLGGGDTDEAYCEAVDTLVRDDVTGGVFILPEADAGTADRVETILRGRPEVSDLHYVDVDESYAEAQELWEDSPWMLGLIEPEDLPTSWRYTVPDPDAALVVRVAVALVVDVEIVDSSSYNRSFRSLARLVADGIIDGGAQRTGPVVVPERVERLKETAPEAVVGEVGLVIEALNEVEVEDHHVRAADAIVTDAEERCP